MTKLRTAEEQVGKRSDSEVVTVVDGVYFSFESPKIEAL